MKKRNKVLVIDVESTCWDTLSENNRYVSEIIEIGITPLDRKDNLWTMGESESLVINPIFSPVSKFCTQLTGWTREDLNIQGTSYIEAINTLRNKYDAKNCIVACWGKYDDKMFQSMSKLHRVSYPFNNDYLNIKALYGVLNGGVTGVGDALTRLNMDFVGAPHRGKDDSYNIARLLLRMIQDGN